MADGNEKIVQDFVAVWDKVMNADRIDMGTAEDKLSQKLQRRVAAAPYGAA